MLNKLVKGIAISLLVLTTTNVALADRIYCNRYGHCYRVHHYHCYPGYWSRWHWNGHHWVRYWKPGHCH